MSSAEPPASEAFVPSRRSSDLQVPGLPPPTSEELSEYRALFEALDVDGSGDISFAELQSCFDFLDISASSVSHFILMRHR